MGKCTKAQFGESTKEQLEDRPFTSYKRSTDLKQNCTQEKAPFSSTVLHTLSHGVIHLVMSVTCKTPSGWLKFFSGQLEASIQWFLKLTLATKQNTPCERVWKTVPENGVFSCVPFCLRSLWKFARCANLDGF